MRHGWIREPEFRTFSKAWQACGDSKSTHEEIQNFLERAL